MEQKIYFFPLTQWQRQRQRREWIDDQSVCLFVVNIFYLRLVFCGYVVFSSTANNYKYSLEN